MDLRGLQLAVGGGRFQYPVGGGRFAVERSEVPMTTPRRGDGGLQRAAGRAKPGTLNPEPEIQNANFREWEGETRISAKHANFREREGETRWAVAKSEISPFPPENPKSEISPFLPANPETLDI